MFCISTLLFWAILYGIVYFLSAQLGALFHAELWLTPVAMFSYGLTLVFIIFRTGFHEEFGLTPLPPRRKWYWFLPLVLMPLLNVTLSEPAMPSAFNILFTLGTCTAEELLFRGFLLNRFLPFGKVRSILLSSSLFALLHSANLFSGENEHLTAVQILLAFVCGIYYCTIRIYAGSVYPCIAAHFLTNITAGTAAAPIVFLPAALLYLCAAAALYPRISSDPEVCP